MDYKHPEAVLAYLSRVGAEVVNFRRALVKVYRGNYYVERALIRISADGISCSSKEFAPTDEEAAAIKEALKTAEWPKTITAKTAAGLKGLTRGTTYSFIDRRNDEIIMVQERRQNDDGTKSYIPWVFLSTGEWASMEPDGELPFWKPEKKRGPGARIMIHEGAKAAHAADRIARGEVKGHPWHDELAQFEHWGMIGGALAPHRSDYDELRRESPSEVVYVCDNDFPGVAALQKVSRHWGKPMKGIRFGKDFPGSWDLADDLPEKMFSPSGRFLGPKLSSLLQPATAATEQLPSPSGKGRPMTLIRPEFADEWLHCVTPEVFVHKEWPNHILSASEFNSTVAPFSHVDDTSRLLKREFASKAAVLKYVPGRAPGIFGDADNIYINTFCPSPIDAEDGDPTPFLDFIRALVPDEKDRFELERWCATLIARPDVRMLYGVLMVSETQGIGKGTLGEKILAPLVGTQNVSYPSEQEIVESQFNYWLAHKRLAVVHEIYAGSSSKAYNKLKSNITDKYLTVQKKYQANYEIENWIHIFACSNSHRALKLSMDDRRWFVPMLTEDKRPTAYWEDLNDWLSNRGGLGIIKRWAENFVTQHGPVEHGAPAPWSLVKKLMIEEAYSPGQALVAQFLNELQKRVEEGELSPDIFVLDSQLVALIRNNLYDGRHNDHLERPSTVRAIAKDAGWHVGKTKVQIRAWGSAAIGSRIIALDPTVAARAPVALAGDAVPEEERRRPLDLTAVATF